MRLAAELEEDLEIVKGICQAASGFAPDYDWGAVYEAWSGNLEL